MRYVCFLCRAAWHPHDVSQILNDDIKGCVSRWSLATSDQVAAAQEQLPDIEEKNYRYRCARCASLNKRCSGPWSPNMALKHLQTK